MSSTLKLNQNYINNTLIPNYAAVAFETELGGNSAYLSGFSYAGSNSTYSFGLFQYDVGAQGSGSSVQNFLTSIGFNATQITQLSQQGGLSTTVQTALSAQLNTALQNPVNQAALDQLNINWAQGLVNQLQSALDVIYQANPSVALQIYGSQELQLRLMDYANQFGLSSTGKMTNWLSGQAVTMASGDTFSLTAGQPLTGAQIDNFIRNTQQGVANLNDNITTRLNALDSIVPALSLSANGPIIDVNGVASPVILDTTGATTDPAQFISTPTITSDGGLTGAASAATQLVQAAYPIPSVQAAPDSTLIPALAKQLEGVPINGTFQITKETDGTLTMSGSDGTLVKINSDGDGGYYGSVSKPSDNNGSYWQVNFDNGVVQSTLVEKVTTSVDPYGVYGMNRIVDTVYQGDARPPLSGSLNSDPVSQSTSYEKYNLETGEPVSIVRVVSEWDVLKGYSTAAIDPETGNLVERDMIFDGNASNAPLGVMVGANQFYVDETYNDFATISRATGVSVDDLIAANPELSPNMCYAPGVIVNLPDYADLFDRAVNAALGLALGLANDVASDSTQLTPLLDALATPLRESLIPLLDTTLRESPIPLLDQLNAMRNGFYGNGSVPLDDFLTGIQKLFHQAEITSSPLILDLNGDGVSTIAMNAGVHFDHNNNRFSELSGWVAPGDGLLVRDLNGNGQVDGGGELFGDNTLLANGQKAASGFAALAELDANHDGIVDNTEATAAGVKLWKDGNQNGLTEAGELLTLNQAGVSSLSIGAAAASTVDAQGNIHALAGSYTTSNGAVRAMDDVWFAADTARTIEKDTVTVSTEIAALPDIAGFGNVHSLHQAMVRDTTGHLQSLVGQFMAATDVADRKEITTQLIYAWAGVENVDPNSRAASMIYGNVIGDARKLASLEALLGESYISVWCWGTPDPNPHGQSAPDPMLLAA